MTTPDPAPPAPPDPTVGAGTRAVVRGLPLAVVLGLFIANLGLRPPLVAIGPLAPLMREDLGVTAAVIGLLTSIPVLCMGLLAPVGPSLAARLGPRLAFASCLALIATAGIVRAVVPSVPLLVLVTVAIGIGIGIAGPIPSMVVADRLSRWRALGTGAYAGGLSMGSTLAALVAVPLAIGGDWRLSLLVLSGATFLTLASWLGLVRREPDHADRPAAVRLPFRRKIAWLLVAVFGLQSAMFYGVTAWLPNVYVERGWDLAHAGTLLALFQGTGLVATLGVPLIADRVGARRTQITIPATTALLGFAGILLVPDAAYLWAAILGLSLGSIFPLALTLPLDVAHEAATVGSVTAMMLLGGYLVASVSPILLGAARDLTGDFTTSLVVLLGVDLAFVGCCLLLSPARLGRGIGAGAGR